MTTTGKLVFGLLLVALVGGGIYYFNFRPLPVQPESFTIAGEQILFKDGAYIRPSAPGSASMTTTTYFGNEVKGDFNNDNKEDRAFLVTQTAGGSGTFYYLATSLGGEAIFLGDRIAPQTTQYSNGEIIINYADRKAGEPMTAAPSVGVSRYFKYQNDKLVEINHEAPVTPVEGTSTTSTTTGKVSENSPEGKCVNSGGTWSKEYKECAGVDSDVCSAIGGTFNECASACRHNPKAEACIMMCVQICTF